MWRAKTKDDIRKEKEQEQKKYNDGLDWSPGYKQTHSVEKGAREYREYKEYRRELEEDKQKQKLDKQSKEQAFVKQIASVQEDEEAFTPDALYQAGLGEREEGNGLMAVTRFWQALVCGDGRAAYPLFEMLRDGEGGVAPNSEMAGIFLFVGRRAGDQRCIDTPNLKNMPFDAAKAVAAVYAVSRGFIVNPGYKITDEIMEARQNAANTALDAFQLKTRSYEETMEHVFSHDSTTNQELLQEVDLSGQDSTDHGSKKCVIL